MHRRLLLEHGAVVRTRALLERGVGRATIDRAVRRGELLRVRKGWVAMHDADPALLFAVRHGLTISCVSRLARLGVWAHDPRTTHFAVPRPGAESRPPGARLLYQRPVFPREPFALEDSVDNALVIAASCQPHDQAVAIWDSALNKKLVTRAQLERLPLTARARAVLDDTDPLADSGLETYVRQRLKRFRLSVIGQAYLLGKHVDLLIGERLVVQTDGATHTGRQRDRDNRHDALLELHDFTVVRVGYLQVMEEWPVVQDLIMRAVAQGQHLRRTR